MARPRRSRRTLTTLVVLVLLSVTIITLDQTGRADVLTSGVKSIASDVYGPLRAGVNGVLDPIGRFFAGAVDYGSLEQENHKLRAEIGALRQSGAEAAAASREYQQFEQLLALEKLPALAALPTVTADVTAVDVSDFAATLTIDKGRDQGVTVGDAVVGGGGLVGQVVQASHTGAIVRLITDGQSNIGVVYGHGENATLDGQGAGKLLAAELVASATPVKVGELMTTSSLQGAELPPGIPVARVSSVRVVQGAVDKQVSATPLADLEHLAYVAVVQWAPTP